MRKEKAIRAQKNPTKGKVTDWAASIVYWDADDIPAHKRQCIEHQVSSAVHELVDDASEQPLDDTVSIHSRTSSRSSASVAHQVHSSNASLLLTMSGKKKSPFRMVCDVQSSKMETNGR